MFGVSFDKDFSVCLLTLLPLVCGDSRGRPCRLDRLVGGFELRGVNVTHLKNTFRRRAGLSCEGSGRRGSTRTY